MSAIVLAGGTSKRFGQDKGMIELARKPLLLHVLDRLTDVVSEIFVVVNSEAQKEKFTRLISHKAYIVVDKADVQTPLAGALVGFRNVRSAYSILLACDTPFISSKMLSFLLDICVDRAAAIPRWPNGNIEPLHAAYHSKKASIAAEIALKYERRDMRSMISNMHQIRYVSTLVLQKFDPKLTSFFNINLRSDLASAEAILKQ